MWERIKKKFRGKKGNIPLDEPNAMTIEDSSLHPSTPEELLEERELQREAAMQKGAMFEAKLHKILPHAQRGKKVRQGGAKGGRATRELYEPAREQYRTALVEYMKTYGKPRGTVSLTGARERIAERCSVSRRTVERHTRDLFK